MGAILNRANSRGIPKTNRTICFTSLPGEWFATHKRETTKKKGQTNALQHNANRKYPLVMKSPITGGFNGKTMYIIQMMDFPLPRLITGGKLDMIESRPMFFLWDEATTTGGYHVDD